MAGAGIVLTPAGVPVTCVPCASYTPGVAPVLCGSGRTTVYGATTEECAGFRTAATAFDEAITGWTTLPNSTTAAYPGCRAALEVLFCSQEAIYAMDDDSDDDAAAASVSTCNDHRRPDHADVHRCRAFCPAIRDACPAEALKHCEERCRTSLAPEYCGVIEIIGLQHSRYPEDTVDLMNLYRIEAEADVPLLRNGRPAYRAIPARRTSGSGGRATKLDYYLYSTRARGYDEWLLDTNDLDSDGAVAHASDGNIEPYRLNSDWSVWHEGLAEWLGEPLRIVCRGDEWKSAAPPRRSRGGGGGGGRRWWAWARAGALAPAAMTTAVLLLPSGARCRRRSAL